jgi:hypothetical protein
MLTGVILSCGAGQRGALEDDDFNPSPDDCYDLKDGGNPWVVEMPASSAACPF